MCKILERFLVPWNVCNCYYVKPINLHVFNLYINDVLCICILLQHSLLAWYYVCDLIFIHIDTHNFLSWYLIVWFYPNLFIYSSLERYLGHSQVLFLFSITNNSPMSIFVMCLPILGSKIFLHTIIGFLGLGSACLFK